MTCTRVRVLSTSGSILRITALAGLLLALAGCGATQTRIDYADQAEQAVAQVPDWSELDGGVDSTYLNELIHSPQLNGLIEEALAANPGLQQTLLTLKIRRAEQRQVGGDRWPQADFSYSASKQESSSGSVARQAGSSVISSSGSSTSYTGTLSVSWQVDLWRKLADDYRAAGKDVAEQAALYQSARDTLAAEIMQAWLQLIAQQNAVEIQQQRLDTLERYETFIRERYRNGVGSLEDLDSARTSTASARETLASQRQTLAQQQRALHEMLGRTGRDRIDIPADYPDVRTPIAELPEQTLGRRPDLKAAYLAIQAESLRTDVAYKDMLPSISLEGTLYDLAQSPTEALLNDPVWSLLGQLTAPLFRGGSLKAAAEVQELTTEQDYQAYRETLLTAVTEVEDAIENERALERRQDHVETALASARRNLAQYERSYRNGLVSILDLLNIQQQTYDLRAQLDNLIYERLVNRIDLGLALGLGVNV